MPHPGGTTGTVWANLRHNPAKKMRQRLDLTFAFDQARNSNLIHWGAARIGVSWSLEAVPQLVYKALTENRLTNIIDWTNNHLAFLQGDGE